MSELDHSHQDLFAPKPPGVLESTYSNQRELRLLETQPPHRDIKILEWPNGKLFRSNGPTQRYLLEQLAITLKGDVVSKDGLADYLMSQDLSPQSGGLKVARRYIDSYLSKAEKPLELVGYQLGKSVVQEGKKSETYFYLTRLLELSFEEEAAIANTILRRIKLLPQYGWFRIGSIEEELRFLFDRGWIENRPGLMARQQSNGFNKLFSILQDPDAQSLFDLHDAHARSFLEYIYQHIDKELLKVGDVKTTLTGAVRLIGTIDKGDTVETSRRIIEGAMIRPSLPSPSED